jgi:integrase
VTAPTHRLCRHRDPERRGLKIGEWPAADQALWQAALVPGGPLDDPGPAAHWSPATRKKVAGSYGRYLGWLQRRGRIPPAASARTLLNEVWVEEYLSDPAQAAASSTVLNRAADLRLFAHAVLPDLDWGWLAQLEAAMRQQARPLRDQRLGLRSVTELVELGERLMGEEAASAATLFQELLAYRDGLMIALLPLVPLRLKNFASLELGRSLMRRGESWWIAVPGAETKAGRPYERPFPERLLPALDYYLDQVRPALARRRGRWAKPIGQAIWVSGHGSPMSEAAVYQQITLRTGEAFGTAINPHKFRHSAATSLALASPEAVRAGAVILGHATFATTERYYNLARAIDAGRRYQDVLEGLVTKRRRR